MIRMILLLLFTTFFSCKNNSTTKGFNMEIIIQDASSYEYDLQKLTFTVSRMEGDTTINFNLEKLQKQQIVDKYYTLGLDKLPNEKEIYGTCGSMPRFDHVINVKAGARIQKIRLDTGCKNYKAGEDSVEAKDINDFIDFVMSILNSKSEIKNAPKSNVIYL